MAANPVMAALVAAIHAAPTQKAANMSGSNAASSPRVSSCPGVDARDKRGHDAACVGFVNLDRSPERAKTAVARKIKACSNRAKPKMALTSMRLRRNFLVFRAPDALVTAD
ncbi:hypothetical protein [Methylocystis sp. JR02]|uniref:hypothetical protein n=1 Tax=Methylocystis sp. JR02 TaxID=3046284 RepID=UPI0024BABBC2|nr:hypothetical protein [Methylocystis sp. JR02]MDJ0448080.1 hypothetical protein [Methylocystis sp. JR02]